jgi:hypothetical protein
MRRLILGRLRGGIGVTGNLNVLLMAKFESSANALTVPVSDQKVAA